MAYYEVGDYECEVTGQGFGEADNENHTPYLWLMFKPLSRQNVPVDAKYQRTVKIWLTDKTLKHAIPRLKSIGWDGASFRDLEPGGACNLAGRRVSLHCSHRQDGSAVYEDWDFPAPEGEGQSTAKNVAGLGRKLDALFGKALSPKPKKAAPEAKPEAAAVQATSQAMPDDDIPF